MDVLAIPQQVQYKYAVTVHQCLWHRAPRYLANFCLPFSEVASCQHLHLASRRKLNIPPFRCSTFGTWAFSVASLTVSNSLPDSLHVPAVKSERFRRDTKTHLLPDIRDMSALEESLVHGITLHKSKFITYSPDSIHDDVNGWHSFISVLMPSRDW